jgi:hypothetical protein
MGLKWNIAKFVETDIYRKVGDSPIIETGQICVVSIYYKQFLKICGISRFYSVGEV